MAKFKFTESQKRIIWLFTASGQKIEKTAKLMGLPVRETAREAMRQLKEVLRHQKVKFKVVRTPGPR